MNKRGSGAKLGFLGKPGFPSNRHRVPPNGAPFIIPVPKRGEIFYTLTNSPDTGRTCRVVFWRLPSIENPLSNLPRGAPMQPLPSPVPCKVPPKRTSRVPLPT